MVVIGAQLLKELRRFYVDSAWFVGHRQEWPGNGVLPEPAE